MKSLLKKYSDENPERFNKDFILSRDKQDILSYVKDIFKSLEVLDEIKVESITLDTSEAEMGPIKNQHRYYKSIFPSRLNKIHYKLKITPSEVVKNIPILDDDVSGSDHTEGAIEENSDTFVREGDIFINKLVDNCFYINEGVRYFLIYQIVDNATYGTGDCVSLKSLLMPITIMQHDVIVEPEFNIMPESLKTFDVMLFNKKINPLLYTLAKDSYNSLIKMEVKDPDHVVDEWLVYKDPTLIDKLNKFWKTDIKFSDKLETEEGRIYFQIKSEKDKVSGCYFSVPEKAFKEDSLTKAVVACLLNIKNDAQKKKIVFTYDDLTTPWFWINTIAGFFTKNSDSMKRFEKVKTMLISLTRLMDDATRNILEISDEDKKNTLTVFRYIIRDFEKLCKADSRDMDEKRLRLFEYQLFPLRKYFSDQIYRVLNSPTRSKAVLDRIFSNLKPMKIIKETVVNELLRYYNSANEMSLYSAFLKCSFKGPQSLNKTVNVIQRDLHPSYAGRISLIAAAAGDPGLSSVLSPFIEVRENFFLGEKKDEEKK